MVNDPYEQARILAQRLKAQGLDDWARKINDIVAGGSTATEILMGLRWATGELLRLNKLDEATQSELHQLQATLIALLR